MKRCNKCNFNNEDNSSLCSNCGEKINKKSVLSIILFSILSLLIIIFIIWIIVINSPSDDNTDNIINDTDISTEDNNECYYTIEANNDNTDIFGNPDKVYHINLDVINNNDLELKCEKSVVNIDDLVKIIFSRNDIQLENNINTDRIVNYDLDIYINNNLIDSNVFKNSEANNWKHTVSSNSFRIYEFNNLYFFTNYAASQCGGAYTLIIDKSGNILKTINDFTYTFNTDNTFTVHDYGNCPVADSTGKDIIYKIEGNAIIEVK